MDYQIKKKVIQKFGCPLIFTVKQNIRIKVRIFRVHFYKNYFTDVLENLFGLHARVLNFTIILLIFIEYS